MTKWFKTYVLSLRSDIFYMLIVDVLFLLVMELWLREIPAPYPIFVKIGNVFVTLAISIIASVIFYFVQVHLPNAKEKERIYPSIAKLFGSMLGLEKDLLTQVLQIKMEDMTEEGIEDSVSKLDLYSEAPLTIGSANAVNHRANWIEYCLYRVERIDKNWNLLINFSTYLDSECMSLLIKIQNDCTYLDQVRRLFPMCNGRMHRLSIDDANLFVEYWHFIEEQEKYYNKVFKPYEAVADK